MASAAAGGSWTVAVDRQHVFFFPATKKRGKGKRKKKVGKRGLQYPIDDTGMSWASCQSLATRAGRWLRKQKKTAVPRMGLSFRHHVDAK